MMTHLEIGTLTMPAAEIGPDNPLPILKNCRELHQIEIHDPDIPAEILARISYGRPASLLPYAMQDDYSRQRQEKSFKVAILENDILRATFLLEYGGRLWSLFHKPSRRELLYVNPVFQPANLALRNAWFSGGVEWNVGTIGHSPFTCSPIFAARLLQGGAPVLRLYEWERLRQIPFQIDIFLPDGSPLLYINVCLRNPHSREIPMYWWSNIAVPETAQTRVIVPADSAYQFDYDTLRRVPIPRVRDCDVSYPTQVAHSSDYFFHIPDDQRPWIAALGPDGGGLVQVSTARLKGRKLFVWGMENGGRRWQEFLSRPGEAYFEIQGGLARTQMEHLPMPAESEWRWLEAYGLLEADPDAVHGSDWQRAVAMTGNAVRELIPEETLAAQFEQVAASIDQAPLEILERGSGWGALERMRREAAGETPFCPPALVFDDLSIREEQAPWVELLRTGRFPRPDDELPSPGLLVQEEWESLLAKAPGTNQNWSALLHLGTMKHFQGNRLAARFAWERSLSLKETPWALRNLAILDQESGLADAAAVKYVAACQMAPHLRQLVVECGQFLVQAGFADQWLSLLKTLPAEIRDHPRVRLLEALAALHEGDLDIVGRYFSSHPVLADLREGEIALSDLWVAYHARRLHIPEPLQGKEGLASGIFQEFPLPYEIDFRQKAAGAGTEGGAPSRERPGSA